MRAKKEEKILALAMEQKAKAQVSALNVIKYDTSDFITTFLLHMQNISLLKSVIGIERTKPKLIYFLC